CQGFWTDWNFPNCCGAVDGKHVQIQAPPNSGSLYYNYKKTYSIVLLAACDHNYKFTLVDCGAYGSNNDAGIFARSEFGNAVQNSILNLPRGEANLPASNIATPCFFIGDEAFPLSKHMMRPYSGRQLEKKKAIFNYRLSRARRLIENTFGILASRWRVFRKPILMHPKSVDKIIMATICLHNYLKTKNDLRPIENRMYCPPNFIDIEQADGNIIPGMWRNERSNCLEHIRQTTAHRAMNDAYKQRNAIAEYLLTPAGSVPWQDDYIRRGFNNTDF
ncbi:protein ALP1-like, partial [Monomorium pharaonis]|uniref:protein ALP1-like n=1 Tax=Monomorium pharaonis TaxID=307658 RepID=UPI0017476108